MTASPEQALYLVDHDRTIRYAHVSPKLEYIPDVYELLTVLDRVAARGRRQAVGT